MANKQLTISLVIPVYNESSNLEWHHKIITDFFEKREFGVQVIYVDDGSKDDSANIIREISERDTRTKFISFSRNFGKEAATTAGLHKATGDAAIMLDADGQHPIELIDQLIKHWREGYQVVIGVRTANQKEGPLKRYGSKLFYKLFNMLSEDSAIPGSTDFRLLDRQVVNEYNKLTERNRITRGLIDWLGFRRAYVEFESPARHGGEATYTYSKLVRLAFHAFVSQTTKPLQATGLIGSTVMLVSALVGIFLGFEKYVFNDPLSLNVTGSAILAIFLSFLVGLVLICQWFLALYIESIHNETQNRPLYIINDQD